MKKYKLLLHIGLHKTATTTFQDNVLCALHKEKNINFLGCIGDPSSAIIRYPLEKIINIDPLSKKVPTFKIQRIKEKLDKILEINKLNVLSEEVLSSSALFNIEDVFDNLSHIFSDCEVTVLVSLRSPVDRLFSHYVQFYPYEYDHNSRLDSFEKFAQDIIHNPRSPEYIEFIYEDFLDVVDKYFSNRAVLLFEDIESDEEHYFQQLSDLLSIKKEIIRTNFFSSMKNVKKTSKSGKSSRSITYKDKLISKINPLLDILRRSQLIKTKALVYTGRLVFKFLNCFVVKDSVEHKYPNKNLSHELQKTVGIKDIDRFSKKYKLSRAKLIRYHYSKEAQL